MANPFEDTLDEVIVYTGSTLVSLETLNTLQGYLSNQEDKIKALARGLAPSLLGHYDKAKVSEKHAPVRLAIVKMFTSLALLAKGRTTLLKEPLGKKKLICFLSDKYVKVRAAGAALFSTMALSPDVHHVLLHNRELVKALFKALLGDDLTVVRETIPCLAQLSMEDTQLSDAAMQRLLQLLDKQPELTEGILQTMWNCCKQSKEKELAIECGAIPALVARLDSPVENVRRLATGTLMAISVAQNGKTALINEKGAIAKFSSFNLEAKTSENLRVNSMLTLRNIAEHPQGLTDVGAALLHEPNVMLTILSEAQVANVVDPILTTADNMLKSLQALMLLSKSNEGKEAIWSILDVVPRLHRISVEQKTPQLRGLSKKVLDVLRAANADAEVEFGKISKDGDDELVAIANATINPNETALLLLQFQNDFLKPKGAMYQSALECVDETQMLWHTIDLVEKARKLGVMVVHLPMEYKGDMHGDGGPLQEIEAASAFKPNTWGSDIADEMTPEKGDAVLRPNGLSGFDGTDLELTLRAKGICDVVVCGIMGEHSVEGTMRGAYDRDFRVFGVADCIASSSLDAQNTLLNTSLPKFGVNILEYKHLLKLLTSTVQL